MIEAVVKFYSNYLNFQGRTRRRDFWLAILAYYIVTIVLGAINGIFNALDLKPLAFLGSGIIFLFTLFNIIPLIAMCIRRLHDTGRSGWWYLGCLVGNCLCGVGSIVLIVLHCLDSAPDNMYGPNPKGMSGMGMGNQQMYNQYNQYNGQQMNNQYSMNNQNYGQQMNNQYKMDNNDMSN